VGDARLLTSVYRQTVALVVAIAIFGYVGFRPSYWVYFPRFEGTSWQVHLHVVTIALWLAMLIGQGWLAHTGRIGSHTRIGRLSYLLVPLIVLSFVLVADYGQRRHKEPGLVAAALFDGGLFLFCYAMAIARRRHPPQHATYMLLTAVAFINPTLGRAWAPEASVPVQAVLLTALLVAARMRRRAWQPIAVVLAGWCTLLLMVLLISVVAPQIINGVWDAIWA
jgi:hypothetical protein